jgi:hypothetical protein
MSWLILLGAVVICLVLSLVLSALTHTFIFLMFLPFLFGPFVLGRQRGRY